MKRRNLLTALAATAAAVPAKAQTLGSIYDPQLASLTLEGRVPLNNILSESPNILSLPAEVLGAIQAGALELRGRMEFNRALRLFRLYQFLVPPSAPYPLPQAPAFSDPTVGSAFDLAIEHMHWYEWDTSDGAGRRVMTVVGRRLGLYKGTVPLEEECGVLQLGLERNAPHRFRLFSMSFAGALVVASVNPAGSVEFDRIRNVR